MKNLNVAIAVAAIDFLNCCEKRRLYEALEGLDGAEEGAALSFLEKCSYDEICRLSNRGLRKNSRAFRWKGAELARLSRAAASICRTSGIKAAHFGQKEFPPLLRQINDPPFALFYRGDISVLFGKTVSVVGTRRLTPDGKSAAREFAYKAASSGFCVVSGLAAGADGAAHQGAVDAFFDGKAPCCRTAAVLAGGVDNLFPPFHKKLAAQMIQNGGAILSECPPLVPAERWRFVQRNRIIAALSPATLVVQAPPGSGAMITADFALGYNREALFHQACFSPAAAAISNLVFKRLQAQEGAAAQRKIQSSPAVYVQDGARVISSFEEFSSLMY